MKTTDLVQRLSQRGFTAGTSAEVAKKIDVNSDGEISPAERSVAYEALSKFDTAWSSSRRAKLADWITGGRVGSDNTGPYTPTGLARVARRIAPDPDKMLTEAVDAALAEAKAPRPK